MLSDKVNKKLKAVFKARGCSYIAYYQNINTGNTCYIALKKDTSPAKYEKGSLILKEIEIL